MQGEPQGKIFINYRRGDDPGFTTALYQNLELEFGAGRLFMDVEGHIKPGDDFMEVIRAQVAECDVLLAVIGPRWAALLTGRAASSHDFVTTEIKAALEQGKRVIPVLVGGAAFPPVKIIPEHIRALARKHAIGLRVDRFRADCQGLNAALKEAFAEAESERVAKTAARMAAEEARKGHKTEKSSLPDEPFASRTTVKLASGRRPRFTFWGRSHDKQMALRIGIVALGAKLAKADGIVTRDKIAAFKEVFKLPPDEEENVGRIFDLTKQDISGFELYARQIYKLCHDDLALLNNLIDGLFYMAVADGNLNPDEERFLSAVATEFGFTEQEYLIIKERNSR